METKFVANLLKFLGGVESNYMTASQIEYEYAVQCTETGDKEGSDLHFLQSQGWDEELLKVKEMIDCVLKEAQLSRERKEELLKENEELYESLREKSQQLKLNKGQAKITCNVQSANVCDDCLE